MSTNWYSQGIKCAHCKRYHATVEDVRLCSLGQSRSSETRGYLTSPPPPPPIAPRPAFTPQYVPPPATQPVPQSEPPRNSWLDELTVPVGRYAVENPDGELRFYIVKENTNPKWKRFRKVFVQASDNEHFIRNVGTKQAILKAILDAGLEIATLRYGLELGVCGVCGRTLTDEDSRARGIGPVCREKVSWL